MRSSTGKPKITKHILSNISRTEDNQSIKFGQLIEYNVPNIFSQKLCRKWRRESSCRPLFSFYKASYDVKASDQHLSFNVLWHNLIWTYSKNKQYKISNCRSRDMFKRSVTSFSNPFCVWFFNKNISHVIFYCLITLLTCLITFFNVIKGFLCTRKCLIFNAGY